MLIIDPAKCPKFPCAPAHLVTQSGHCSGYFLAQKDSIAAPPLQSFEVSCTAHGLGDATFAWAAFESDSPQRITSAVASVHDGLLRGQAAARGRFLRHRHRMPR